MKKIFLIDDSLDRVLEIFGNIYKMLWKGKSEDGIAAEVIFFGDQSKKRNEDSELQQKNIDFLVKAVKGMLRSHCRDEEQWNCNGEMYGNKKKLIENMAKSVSISENDEIEKIVKLWKCKDKLNEAVKLEEMDFSPLINKMLAGEDLKGVARDEIYILLDVILLFDDINQIGEGIPIISMGLYHALKKQNYKCFLYSSYTFDYLLIDNYKEIYFKYFGETIEVHQSKVFFSKEINSKDCLFYQLNE